MDHELETGTDMEIRDGVLFQDIITRLSLIQTKTNKFHVLVRHYTQEHPQYGTEMQPLPRNIPMNDI